MKAFFGILAVAAALAAAPARAEHPVMSVLGETLVHETRGQSSADPAEVGRLAEAMRARIFHHYVAENGLKATPAEIAELAAYHAEFQRRDRAQRARKLAELDERLASNTLSPVERAHLEDFRATLARLAAYEAEQDRKPPADAAGRADNFAPWIELWKLHPVLYERFGGAVALLAFGHYPQGAWAALIDAYERRGDLQFHDGLLRERVMAMFNAPPRVTVAPRDVEFTPYWRKPIPPSYFPDVAPLPEKRDP